MPRKKKSNPRPPGRQNAFTGMKLEYLDGFKDEWKDTSDKAGFYTKVTREFIQHFGYRLKIEENPMDDEGEDNHPEPIELLPLEEQAEERDRRESFYKDLRLKLQNWFRHRFKGRSQNQAYTNKVLDHILSMIKTRSNKRSELNIYRETYYQAKLKKSFDAQWDRVKDLLKPTDRLSICNQFVKDSWEKEMEEVREEITAKWKEEVEMAVNEKKEPAFNGSPVEYERAWRTAEDVLPTFADALAEWLGANITILAISPRNGEIVMQLVQSDTSKGMTKKLLPEWDSEGFCQMHEMVVKYGKAYFPPEECIRCILNESSLDNISDEDNNNGNIDVGTTEDKGRAESAPGTNHVARPDNGQAVFVDFNDHCVSPLSSTPIPVAQEPAIVPSSNTRVNGSHSVPDLTPPCPPLTSSAYHPDLTQLQSGNYGVPHGIAVSAFTTGQDQPFNWTVPNLDMGIDQPSLSLLQQLNDPRLSSEWFSLFNTGSQDLAGHSAYLDTTEQGTISSMLSPSLAPAVMGAAATLHFQSQLQPSQMSIPLEPPILPAASICFDLGSQHLQQPPCGNVVSLPLHNTHAPIHDSLRSPLVSLPAGDSPPVLLLPVLLLPIPLPPAPSPPIPSMPIPSMPVSSPPVPLPPVPSPPVPSPPVPLPSLPLPSVLSLPIPSWPQSQPSHTVQPVAVSNGQINVSSRASLPSSVSQETILQSVEKENIGDSTGEKGPGKKGQSARTKGTMNKRKATEVIGEEHPRASRKKKNTDTGKDKDAPATKEPLVPARRPTRAAGLPEHLKGTGYVPPRKGMRAPK